MLIVSLTVTACVTPSLSVTKARQRDEAIRQTLRHSPFFLLTEVLLAHKMLLRMLTFLACRTCETSPVLRQHLNDALNALGWPPLFAIIDADTLPPHDPRRTYPLPTVLWGGRDLFGIAEMPMPYPPPT